MKSFLTGALVALLATSAMAQTAPAPTPEPKCHARADITKAMISDGASPVFVAPISPVLIFEIWSNGKKWTAFHTTRDGRMCPVSGGENGFGMARPMCVDPVKCPAI